MGISLLDNFDIAQPKPLDSRMLWTGSATNLNSLPNKYVGLITYVSGDRDLYAYRAGNLSSLLAWEKVVMTNVDTPTQFTSDIILSTEYNGLVLQVNSSNTINVTLPSTTSFLQSGYNVTFVQMGTGNIKFNNSTVFFFRNRLGLSLTAGQYAVASILRLGNSQDVLLYGDLV